MACRGLGSRQVDAPPDGKPTRQSCGSFAATAALSKEPNSAAYGSG